MPPGERFNGYSHLAGAVVAIAVAASWLATATPHADAATVAGVLVFAMSAITLYAASTMFHGSRGAAKLWWQRVDHCAIYGMIAGTYTPFALVVLHGVAVWLALGGIWATAAFGIAREWRAGAGAAPSLTAYVAVGWMAVAAAAPIAAELRGPSLAWLLIGALLYSAGTLFYRHGGRLRHAHGAWHLFVLAGTACHGVSVAGLIDTAR